MARNCPRLFDAYQPLTRGIWPAKAATAPPELSPYSPAACGWALTLVRLLGSALIIAAIEEFFWRGFFYRVLLGQSFTRIDLRRFDLGRFLLVVFLFGVEHDRWVVGMVAGAAYGILVIRTGNLWSGILAHGLTNLLLGGYVLMTGSYQFW